MEALNPVLDGITRAYAMFAQMQTMKRQDEHLRLAEREMQRRSESDNLRQQVEDINARARLLEMGTPLGPGGMLERRATVDAGSMPGQAAPIEFNYAERPDPSKVLSYKGRDGQTTSIVPFTREEREKMALDHFKSQKQAELDLRSQMEDAELRRRGIAIPEQLASRLGVPGLAGRVVPATELDSLIRAGAYFTAMNQKPEDPVQSVQMVTNDRGDATPVVVRRSGKVETGAPMKGAGKTARPPRGSGAGNGAQQRYEEKRLTALQKEHDSLQVKEHQAWADSEAAKEEIAAATEELKTLQPGKPGYAAAKAREAKARAKYTSSRSLAQSLLQQKQSLLQRKEGLTGGAGSGKDPLGVLGTLSRGAAKKTDPLGLY